MYFLKKEKNQKFEILESYNIIDIIINKVPILCPNDIIFDKLEIIEIKYEFYISLIDIEKIIFKGNNELEKLGYTIQNKIYYKQEQPIQFIVNIKNNYNFINVLDQDVILGELEINNSLEEYIKEVNDEKTKIIKSKKEKKQMKKFILNFINNK